MDPVSIVRLIFDALDAFKLLQACATDRNRGHGFPGRQGQSCVEESRRPFFRAWDSSWATELTFNLAIIRVR